MNDLKEVAKHLIDKVFHDPIAFFVICVAISILLRGC